MRKNKREAILEAAERLFSERGYEYTSVRDITREAGTTLSNFYHHFDRKSVLLSALLTPRVTGLIQVVLANEKQEPDPIERILIALRGTFRLVANDPLICSMFRHRFESDGESDEIGFRQFERFERVVEQLAEVVVDDLRDRGVQTYRDPAALTHVVLMSIVGYCSQRPARLERCSQERFLQALSSMLRAGIERSRDDRAPKPVAETQSAPRW